MSRERNLFLDFLRGCAIIIVVVGHAIQICSGHSQNHVHIIIQTFQMPLLFMISGFSTGYSEPITDINSFFKNKIKRLLIPYVLWSQMHYLLNSIVKHKYSLYDQIRNLTESQFWFLRILFYIYIVYTICYVIKNLLKELTHINKTVINCIVIVTGILATYILSYILGEVALVRYIPFFVIGNILYKIKETYADLEAIHLKVFYAILGVLTMLFVVSAILYFSIDGIMKSLIDKSMALSGSATIYFIVRIVYNTKLINKVKGIVSHIGRNTLPIYAIHWCIFFGSLNIPLYRSLANKIGIYLSSLIVSAIWIIFCQLAIKLMRKSRITRIALLGEK